MEDILFIKMEKMKKIPAYQMVYDKILKDIRNEIYPKNTLLPTEPQLEEMYNVSRTTVRHAISMLSKHGYIKVTQGRGAEVVDRSIVQQLNCVSSVTETLKAQGYDVENKSVGIALIPASNFLKNLLNMEENEKIWQLQRLKYAGGKPVAMLLNYVREKYVPDMDRRAAQLEEDGLYRLLEKEYNINIRHAEDFLSAVAAEFVEAQMLQIETGTPLLVSRRIVYTDEGPFEYEITKLVSNVYEYHVHLTGRTGK